MDMDYNELEKLNLSTWRRQHPAEVEAIVQATDFLTLSATLRQRVWHLARGIYHPIKCANPSCGMSVKWCAARNVYKTYCCNFCNTQAPASSEKRRQTCVNKYGVDNVFKDRDKVTESWKRKLGVDHPQRSSEVRQKVDSTNIERYGQKTILKTKQHAAARKAVIDQAAINGKISATKAKQASDFAFWKAHHCSVEDNSAATVFEQMNDPAWLAEQHTTQTLTEIAGKLGVTQPLISCKFAKFGLPVTHNDSIQQKQLHSWIVDRFPDIIVETNSRSIIKPYELDLFFPEYNLAIEFDGIFWHGEHYAGRDKAYHVKKTMMCEEKGIRLIHVFENEWLYKTNIVKSRIANALGYTPVKIFARMCTIGEISGSTASEFFDANHIQGGMIRGGGIHYALFHNNSIVTVASFGKSRYDKTADYELLRLASVLNTVVVGGAAKLFKHFIKTHSPHSVVSYGDRRWAAPTSSVYEQLGFKFVCNTKPNYFYFHRESYPRLMSRQRFQKHKLAGMLPTFESTVSEWDNMTANGYDRIWDCGHHKWMWTR